MFAIIDSRSTNYQLKLYSVSLMERILRQLHESGVRSVYIVTDNSNEVNSVFRKDFKNRYKMNFIFLDKAGTLSDSLRKNVNTDDACIFFEADGLYDDRVIKLLIDSAQNTEIINELDTHAPAAIKMDVPTVRHFLASGFDLQSWLDQNRIGFSFHVQSVQSMNTYIRFLRRHVTPYLVRIGHDTDLRALENDMYANSFKGGMELIAAYGYRLPVRELTRLCARTSISPNQITGWSVVAKLGAIPAFFAGCYYTGLLLAILFIILDSLDGKLARMTVRYSRTADRWDHLTSLPSRMGWFLGMGWFFSGGNLSDPSAIAALILTVTNFADKMVFNIFNAIFGRSPLDYTEFDRIVNLFNVKRNDVFLMFIMSLLGFAIESFYFITLWTVLIFIWRVIRIIWLRFFAVTDKQV